MILKNSQSNECFYIDSYDLERKKILEKLALTLKFKYNRIFKENKYDIKSLVSDLKENVTYNDVKNLSYEFIFTKIEHVILKKLNALDGFSKSLEYSHNLSSLIPLDKSILKSTQIGFNNKKGINLSPLTINGKTNWLKIAKFKDLKARDEDYFNKVKEKEQKKIYNDLIAKQIKEKEFFILKEKEIENDLTKRYIEYTNDMNNLAKKKQEEKIKKVYWEKNKMLEIHKEKKRTIDERNSRFKQESTNFINDLKLQIEAEKINNQVKNREIKNKYQQMMKTNLQDLNTRKNMERSKSFINNLNEREKIDNDVKANKIYESQERLNRQKRCEDALKFSEIDKEMRKLKELKQQMTETEKEKKEFSIISKKNEEIENQRKLKYVEMNRNVILTIKKQLEEKKDMIKTEFKKKCDSDSDSLRNLKNANEIENVKVLNKKINLHKLMDDWDKQKLSKSPSIDMNLTEMQLNKDLIYEMINYRSPKNIKLY